jgi:hypothetical protein
LTWRDLNALRDNQGAELYRLCLEYGQQLWLDDLPARALLAVDRSLYCDVPEGDVALTEYAMPYRAIGWMVEQPTDAFTGNARVHYQHLADRVRGERANLKKWRAWAAWAITRHVRPDLEGDAKHIVTEPTHAEIEAGLRTYGLPSEIVEWRKALAD